MVKQKPKTAPVSTLKQLHGYFETMLPLPNESMKRKWQDTEEMIFKSLKATHRDIVREHKEPAFDKIKRSKEASARHRLLHQLNSAFYCLHEVMFLQYLSLHLSHDALQDRASIEEAKSRAARVEEEFGKHKEVLDLVHNSMDRYVEAMKHGEEIYE